MERIYAFTDEFGSFGWDFEKENVSTHFIITIHLINYAKQGIYAVRQTSQKNTLIPSIKKHKGK